MRLDFRGCLGDRSQMRLVCLVHQWLLDTLDTLGNLSVPGVRDNRDLDFLAFLANRWSPDFQRSLAVPLPRCLEILVHQDFLDVLGNLDFLGILEDQGNMHLVGLDNLALLGYPRRLLLGSLGYLFDPVAPDFPCDMEVADRWGGSPRSP